MKPDQAAKVLRRHNEWRRGADDNHWQQSPYSPAELGHAIDAAVAALEVAAVPVAYRYRIGGPTVEWRYAPGDATLTRNAIVESEPLYAAPQPAYCCAKCGLAEMATKPDDQRCGSCNDIHDTFTPCNNDHEDDAA